MMDIPHLVVLAPEVGLLNMPILQVRYQGGMTSEVR